MNIRVMLSQVFALIKVSFNTSRITISDCGLVYDSEKGGFFSVKWKRGKGIFGHEMMYLYFSYHHTEEDYRGKRAVLRIYLFDGDSYNDRTQWIYFLLGNQIEIVDDIGLCGSGDKYFNTWLEKINPYNLD